MRYIDFEDFEPGKDWLKESKRLTEELIKLHKSGDIKARNKFIDDNSAHWGRIKDDLLKLSDGKCWFSEARDIFSHIDVEHFRPKKEVKEIDGTNRDGYWWLAFDYHNYRACGNVGNRKKGGWFPLRDGSIVSAYDRPCEESEEPYLLDPTDPDDVELLAFDEEGKAIPAPGIAHWEQERVEVTIERLKLNEHAPLSEERRKIWQRMVMEIDQYQYSKSRCKAGGNPAARAKAKEHARKIKTMVQKSEELSSVAKWCVLFRGDYMLFRLIS